MRGVAATAVVLVYAGSLVLPTAARFNPEFTVYRGVDAFMDGFNVLLEWEPAKADWWILAGAWLANPLLWVAWVSMVAGWQRVCRATALLAVLLCLPVLVRYAELLGPQLASGALLGGLSWLQWSGQTPRTLTGCAGLVGGAILGFLVGAVLGFILLDLSRRHGVEAAGTEAILVAYCAIPGAILGGIGGLIAGLFMGTRS
jgi:hypothetical protein